jgi:hypothetical protein
MSSSAAVELMIEKHLKNKTFKKSLNSIFIYNLHYSRHVTSESANPKSSFKPRKNRFRLKSKTSNDSSGRDRKDVDFRNVIIARAFAILSY